MLNRSEPTRRSFSRRRLHWPIRLAAIGAAALCCSPVKPLVVDAPRLGDFVSDAAVAVSGLVEQRFRETSTLFVNGNPVTLGLGGSFDSFEPVEPQNPFQSIDLLLARNSNGQVLSRRRLTTIAGESIGRDQNVADGLGLRLSDLALDTLAQEFADEIQDTLDIEELIRSSNPVAEEKICIVPTPFGCGENINAEANVERVLFEKLKVNADSRRGFLKIEVIIKGLQVDYETDGDIDCEGRIRTNKVTIPGDYTIRPHPDRLRKVDIELLNESLGVKLEGFDHDFTGGGCDGPLIDDLVEEMLGDIDGLLKSALKDVMRDPDGDGPEDSPVAEGIEKGIKFREIWSPVGGAFDVDLDPHLGLTDARRKGLTFGFDPLVGDPVEGCEAGPDLGAALSVPNAAIDWGELTPSGAVYDLGVSLAVSTLNQMLRARTGCGWLRSTVDEIDLGAGPLRLTAGLLSLFIPELGSLPPQAPVSIRLQPMLAPLITGQAGPNGEPMDLRIAHWLIDLRTNAGDLLVQMVLDLRAGLVLDFSPDGLGIEIALGQIPPESVRSQVVGGTLPVDEASASAAVAALVPTLMGSLGLDLDPIPLPPIGGLELAGVEVSALDGQVIAFFEVAPPE